MSVRPHRIFRLSMLVLRLRDTHTFTFYDARTRSVTFQSWRSRVDDDGSMLRKI